MPEYVVHDVIVKHTTDTIASWHNPKRTDDLYFRLDYDNKLKYKSSQNDFFLRTFSNGCSLWCMWVNRIRISLLIQYQRHNNRIKDKFSRNLLYYIAHAMIHSQIRKTRYLSYLQLWNVRKCPHNKGRLSVNFMKFRNLFLSLFMLYFDEFPVDVVDGAVVWYGLRLFCLYCFPDYWDTLIASVYHSPLKLPVYQFPYGKHDSQYVNVERKPPSLQLSPTILFQ